MSSLFKNLRIHQVFGANTDNVPTHYLKPVSTGPLEDADDRHVKFYASAEGKEMHARCLFRYDDPVSPHLAARLSNKQTEAPSDGAFVTAVADHIRRTAQQTSRPSHMYVETAGGIHSPTLSGTTQVDAYRPLFLPTILVGDSHLGGISTTISSYESLSLRGYIIDLVLLFKDAYYRNFEYLTPYFSERGIRVLPVDPPHKRLTNPDEERVEMGKYYSHLVPDSLQGGMFDALGHLDKCHADRIAELDSMPRRTSDTIWWPFVQHGLVKGPSDINVIDSASKDFFSIYNGHRATASQDTATTSLLEPQLDGSASWWTQAIGHAHPSLTLAAACAAGRYGHVMFPEATHAPALRLAERLVHEGPGKGWASRAFFSDDGSTGMEVALKMALRAYASRNPGATANGERRKDLGILGLKGSYHGDTIGAMDACEEGVYTCEWHDAKGCWLDPPTVSNKKGRVVVSLPASIASAADGAVNVDVGSLQQAYDVQSRLDTPLAKVYRGFVTTTLKKLKERGMPEIAALVLEPLVMGAGGMIFVDPLFQRVLIDVVRASEAHPPAHGGWYGLPVIFDEVFVGFYRLGLRTTGPLLGVNPDISVHAKILTGGLLPLAVTLASDFIFQAFNSDSKLDALLHGHSYTAYPVGCEVANETLRIVEKMAESGQWDDARAKWGVVESAGKRKETSVWSLWTPDFVDKLARLDVVDEVMTLGTVLAFKIRDSAGGYGSHSAQKLLQSLRLPTNKDAPSSAPGGAPFGTHYRTLGDVAYFILSLNTAPAVVDTMQSRILAALQSS
ncbi:onanonoxo-7-onima-8-eninoihtemlysoneda [Fomitopsis serialis]|uniref:onanonoxo-7-onima-8-eninoihtemlysoneda n=1 Tax=Fomitopsis serialis TaxID=139415 RepID=UPI0020086047|nr:onanonoxo-7-onima-8-eninoihtemlysoneda [Neoantrodia serialis]KAH9930141.1 onanonoxo-7-onima-8-eninoihtemlysoneda [Neoantrodia serialis]